MKVNTFSDLMTTFNQYSLFQFPLSTNHFHPSHLSRSIRYWSEYIFDMWLSVLRFAYERRKIGKAKIKEHQMFTTWLLVIVCHCTYIMHYVYTVQCTCIVSIVRPEPFLPGDDWSNRPRSPLKQNEKPISIIVFGIYLILEKLIFSV